MTDQREQEIREARARPFPGQAFKPWHVDHLLSLLDREREQKAELLEALAQTPLYHHFECPAVTDGLDCLCGADAAQERNEAALAKHKERV